MHDGACTAMCSWREAMAILNALPTAIPSFRRASLSGAHLRAGAATAAAAAAAVAAGAAAAAAAVAAAVASSLARWFACALALLHIRCCRCCCCCSFFSFSTCSRQSIQFVQQSYLVEASRPLVCAHLSTLSCGGEPSSQPYLVEASRPLVCAHLFLGARASAAGVPLVLRLLEAGGADALLDVNDGGLCERQGGVGDLDALDALLSSS